MRILSNLSVSGLLGLNSVADANTDTDKFLVLDSSGIVKYRTGTEVFNDIGAGGAASYTSTLQHEVKAGVALTKGQAVYVTSADGTNMIVSKASNVSEGTSSKTLGLIAQNLNANGKGFVITEGLLAGLDTSTALTEGDPVWLGTDGNLIYGLTNKPYAPAHLVFIGIVTRKSSNNGEIFVKVQNGFELQEIHNVQITSTPSDNTVLAYETSTSLYKMKSISTLLGYTPVTNARNITINGTTYDLSADRSWSVGTLTGTLNSGYVPKATGSTSLANGLIYDTGSAVLIGTQTAGSGKFMVYSTSPDNHYQAVGSAPSFRFADTITSPNYTGIFGLATASNHFIIGALAGDMVLSNNTTSSIGNFLFGTGATERMRISPAGNISINNTNNTYRLDVTGTVRFTGQLRLESTITNGTHTYTLPSATGTLALTSDIPTNPITGTGTINVVPKFYTANSIGDSNLFDTGTTIYNNNPTAGQYAWQFNGSTTSGQSFGVNILAGTTSADVALRILNASGSGEYLRVTGDGNLLVGTSTNGTFKLDVNGTARVQGVLTLSSTITNGTNTYTLPSATGTLALTSDIPSLSGYVPTSRTITINGVTYDLSADRSWTVAGGVGGSGTTNYLPKFTGASTIGNSNLVNDASGNLLVGTASSTGASGILLATQNASGQSYYRVNNAGLSTVGLTSAYAGLVVGDGAARGFEVIHRGQYSTLTRYGVTVADYSMIESYGTNSNGIIIGTVSAKPIIFGTNSLGRMTLDASGNLGLGNTPDNGYTGYKLQIGSSSDSQTFLSIGNSTTGLGPLNGLVIGNDSTGADIYQRENAPLRFHTNNTERMRLNASGNLSVGNTNDTYKLDVLGPDGSVGTIRWANAGGRKSGFLYSDSAGVAIYDTNLNDAGIYLAANTKMDFRVNGSIRLEIASTGAATFSSNSNSTINNTFQNTNTTDSNSRNYFNVVAGNVTTSIKSIHNDHSYIDVTNNLYFQSGGGVKMTMLSSGNVGIGTTSPTEILHLNSSNNAAFIRFQNTGGSGVYIGGRNDDMEMYTGGSEKMRITSGGNVGIGSSSPLAVTNFTTLTINGTNASLIEMQSSGTSYARIQASSSEMSLIARGNTPMVFYTNPGSDTERMRITSGGNVGIGTTSPQRTLDVFGSGNNVPAASFGTGLPIGSWSGIHFGYSEAGNSAYRKSALVFERTGNAAEGKVHILNNGFADTSSASLSDARLTILSNGNVGINTTSPSYNLEVWTASSGSLQNALNVTNGANADFTVRIKTSETWIGPTTATPLIFANSSNTERMRITSGGDLLVGTTTDFGVKLAVNGNMHVTNSDARIRGGDAAGRLIFSNSDTTSYIVANGSSNGNSINVITSSFISFNTGASYSEAMRITSGGQLLIGTTSSSGVDKVRVNNDGTTSYSTVNITNANSTANMYVGVGGSSVANGSLQNNAYVWNAAASALVFGTSDSERMRITSGGDLLVGTTNNSYSNANRGVITVSGASQAIYGLSINGQGKGYMYHEGINLYMENSVSGGFFNITQVGAGYIALTTNATERMRITSSGNVGINTNNPQRQLDVASPSIAYIRTTQGTSSVFNEMYSTSMGGFIGTASSHNLALQTAGTTRMTITNGGLLFINTTMQVATGFVSLVAPLSTNIGFAIRSTNAGNSGQFMQFQNSSSVQAGAITHTGATTVAFTTTSDYRLKQDFQDFNGLDLLGKIKMYNYEWKEDKSRAYGVIAHELQSIIGYAVSGVKDGDTMQGVDYSKIVPVLVKAVQEQQSQINELKSQLNK